MNVTIAARNNQQGGSGSIIQSVKLIKLRDNSTHGRHQSYFKKGRIRPYYNRRPLVHFICFIPLWLTLYNSASLQKWLVLKGEKSFNPSFSYSFLTSAV